MKKAKWTMDKSDHGNIIPMTVATERLLQDLAKHMLDNNMNVQKHFNVQTNNHTIIITQ
tara:strand:- start:6085 stop:6261 length:177 start_codon:yes stop_codon:yes gene_type:complete